MKRWPVSRATVAVVLLFALVYSFAGRSGSWSGDMEFYWRLAENLVRDGRVDLDPHYELLPGRHGRYYSWQDPGTSLALAPLVVIGDPLTRAARAAGWRINVAPFLGSYLPPLCLALAMGIYHHLLRRDVAAGSALLATLTAGLATQLLVSAAGFTAEPLQVLGFLALYLGLVRRRPAEAALPLFLLGIVKAYNVIAVVPAGLAIWFWFPADRRRRAGWWLGGVLLAIAAVHGWYNWARFGDPFVSGYVVQAKLSATAFSTFSTPVGEGVYGLLLSSGKGAFLYSPPLLLALFAWPQWWRRHRPEALFPLLLPLGLLLGLSAYWGWHGDYSWGPRLLVPILPLALLPLGLAVEHLRGTALRRVFFTVVIGCGLAVQGLGLVFDPTFYPATYSAHHGIDIRHLRIRDPWAELHFVPAYSPLLAHLRMAGHLWRGETAPFVPYPGSPPVPAAAVRAAVRWPFPG